MAIVTLGILAKLPGLTVLVPMAYAAIYLLRGQGALTSRRIYLLLAFFVLAAIPIIAYYRWAIYLGTTYPPYHVAGGGYIWDEGELSVFWQNRFYVRELADHLRWFLKLPVFALAAIGFVAPFLCGGKNQTPSVPWLFHAWFGPAFFSMWSPCGKSWKTRTICWFLLLLLLHSQEMACLSSVAFVDFRSLPNQAGGLCFLRFQSWSGLV